MEFPMKVVVILLLAMITLVIILLLSGVWTGRSGDIFEGLINLFKDLGIPVGD